MIHPGELATQKNNKMNQKGFAPIIVILGIVLLLGVAGGAYYFGTRKAITPIDPRACTQEAKICPDGTSVGRTGPTCEFSPCPTVAPANTTAETADWKTYTNTKYNYSIKYPADYSAAETSPDYVRIFQGFNDPKLPETETYLSIQIDTSSFKDSKITYKITPDGKTLRITSVIMSTEDNDKQKVQSIFDQILSTFKFN